MRIAVLIKEVPDTYGDRLLDLETGIVARDGSEAVLDEISERALELALSHADGQDDVHVTVVTMAPAAAAASVRRALAMGAGEAIHVADDRLAGADLLLTAQVLAAVIGRGGFDLVIAGNQSTDGAAGMLPAMLAEHLGQPHVTGLSEVVIERDSVTGTRPLETCVQNVAAPLPAVVSITEALPDGRMPSFKGIIAAKKKPYRQPSLTELGIDAPDTTQPASVMLSVARKPPRAEGIKIADEGDAARHLAAFLIENGLA